MLIIESKGDFRKTDNFLKKMARLDIASKLKRYGHEGVAALASATPTDTGLASNSWYFEVETKGKNATITWLNSNTESGFPVAIMLQYGHGTGTGGYVSGRDYINPSIRPIFDKIAESVWKEVTSA